MGVVKFPFNELQMRMNLTTIIRKKLIQYVEIKCQLDATEVLLQILLLAQHVSGTTMPIIRSSRVLYSGCCLWYFVLWFSSCWSGVELRLMCPVCRMLQAEGYMSSLQDAAASCKLDT